MKKMILSPPVNKSGRRLYLINSSEDCASTITAAHSFIGNIVNPKGGHKQMGVYEEFAEEKEDRRGTDTEA